MNILVSVVSFVRDVERGSERGMDIYVALDRSRFSFSVRKKQSRVEQRGMSNGIVNRYNSAAGNIKEAALKRTHSRRPFLSLIFRKAK